MNPLRWIWIVPLLSVVACRSDQTARQVNPGAKPARPNIVLVMTDDQGYGDFGHKNHPVLETPRLDAFAKQCPKVDRFYVSPVCSATRACLMTGRYNYRTRVVDTWRGRSMMEPNEVTVAECLQAAGYATGIFGKWHLGDSYPMRPQDQGFGHSLVHKGGGLAQSSDPIETHGRYTNPVLYRNGEQVETEGYCTDVYVDEALEFIDANLDVKRPFFAYIAPNAPHGPFHDVPEDLYAKYKDRDMSGVLRGEGFDPDKLARTFAMIENIDQNVGRLLDHLDERGATENTLFIFMTDNGPLWGRHVDGLLGHKTTVHEGGIRSPLWARWPGHIDSSTRIESIAAHIDILPTVLEAAGITPDESVRLDGRSLLPLFEGRGAEWPERQLFIQAHRGDAPSAEHQFAVIGQRWKLVRPSGFGKREAAKEDPLELFDLDADPGESKNLASSEPERVAAMRADYAAWFSDVSSTRPKNYAPPRIEPGTDREPRTLLTHQDWRSPDPESWCTKGGWQLFLDRPRKLEVTILFRKAREVQRVRAQLGARQWEPAFTSDGLRVELGAIEFPKGEVDLWFDCDGPEKTIAPYQVLLERK